ncbi:ACP S-malonyltransferase [Silvanigrella aquatica]|uniref:Malonyl CoA-acyl carrier protein transacylase n=1 Tax=Silvanigrella aquatica TaxID=1915309 RepID=A0A1L4CYF7_9BACT|nr:ACP S-malonyltransferase [Silvanigrella aquatica]APJ02965.1 [acyl-carrier-protein] S-malonyltransferase [Silvanigrella aquatica]
MADVVFMFPGQGSQSVGMGKDFFEQFQEVKQTFEEASDILGFNMAKLCFEDSENKLNLTEFTQPTILTLSTALFRVLEKRASAKSTLVAGHSLGEYSALVSLGALSFSDALKAVHFRGQAMQRAVPVGVGAMAAYLGNAGQSVPNICKEVSTNNAVVEVVNFNSPGQLVLSGHKVAVEKACEVIAEKKLGKAKTLPVSAPFHSFLMQPAAEEMKDFLSNTKLHSFAGQIVANVDAKIHTNATYSKEILVRQIASAVLWTQSLATIHDSLPEALWIEVGPGKVLQGLAKKTIENSNCMGTHDLVALHAALEFLLK